MNARELARTALQPSWSLRDCMAEAKAAGRRRGDRRLRGGPRAAQRRRSLPRRSEEAKRRRPGGVHRAPADRGEAGAASLRRPGRGVDRRGAAQPVEMAAPGRRGGGAGRGPRAVPIHRRRRCPAPRARRRHRPQASQRSVSPAPSRRGDGARRQPAAGASAARGDRPLDARGGAKAQPDPARHRLSPGLHRAARPRPGDRGAPSGRGDRRPSSGRSGRSGHDRGTATPSRSAASERASNRRTATGSPPRSRGSRPCSSASTASANARPGWRGPASITAGAGATGR